MQNFREQSKKSRAPTLPSSPPTNLRPRIIGAKRKTPDINQERWFCKPEKRTQKHRSVYFSHRLLSKCRLRHSKRNPRFYAPQTEKVPDNRCKCADVDEHISLGIVHTYARENNLHNKKTIMITFSFLLTNAQRNCMSVRLRQQKVLAVSIIDQPCQFQNRLF